MVVRLEVEGFDKLSLTTISIKLGHNVEPGNQVTLSLSKWVGKIQFY